MYKKIAINVVQKKDHRLAVGSCSREKTLRYARHRVLVRRRPSAKQIATDYDAICYGNVDQDFSRCRPNVFPRDVRNDDNRGSEQGES